MAGTITALRMQRKNKERVNVYLDGRFAFGLPAMVAARLKKGQYLSDEEIARLKAVDEEERAYERSLRFLSYRPRSIAEVRRYLKRCQIDPRVIDAVVERLIRAGYLNDQAFVSFWVDDRERFRPRGRQALRHELRQKGVADEIIEEALSSLDEEASAYRAGLAQARRWQKLDRRQFGQKLGSYLLRRGFAHEVVWPVVERLWQELVDDSNGLDST